MIVKGIVDEDFVNYKKASMFVLFPYCCFKCDFEAGTNVCQNSSLAHLPNIEITEESICERYLKNPITNAIVFGGLEPFDSYECLTLTQTLREKYQCNDDIVIYTGYDKQEIPPERFDFLKQYPNVIIKFGRFVPNQASHYDEVLGVNLASDNQYAEKIS